MKLYYYITYPYFHSECFEELEDAEADFDERWEEAYEYAEICELEITDVKKTLTLLLNNGNFIIERLSFQHGKVVGIRKNEITTFGNEIINFGSNEYGR